MEGFDLRNLLNPEHWFGMDRDGEWFIYKEKPVAGGWCWITRGESRYLESDFFNLPTCENWEESLIQVKDFIKD